MVYLDLDKKDEYKYKTLLKIFTDFDDTGYLAEEIEPDAYDSYLSSMGVRVESVKRQENGDFHIKIVESNYEDGMVYLRG